MGIVILGAGGKLGRLIQPHWPGDATWHTRTDVDVLDRPQLISALRGASAVICLAGVTNGTDRPMSLNKTLAELTLDAAAACGAGHVFLMSSAAVYGRQSGLLTEETPTAPLNEYGHAKVAMEDMAAVHTHPNTALRLGNIAGADAILGGWKAGFALDSFEDGSTPRRSYIGLQTLARIMHDLCHAQGLPAVLNVAAPGAIAMGDLLDAAGLAWSPRSANGETIAQVTLDTSRLCGFTTFQDSDSEPAGLVAQWNGTQNT